MPNSKTKPKAIVVSGDGVNCENETVYGLKLADFDAESVHISSLLKNPHLLDEASLLVLPGGFSFGDEIQSGRVLAVKLMETLTSAIEQFVAQGKLVIGICNGFQTLVQMGLLPENKVNGKRSASLVRNKGARFINKWVSLEVPESARKGYFDNLSKIDLPIRHGEGRVLALEGQESNVDTGCALRYVEDVNGSLNRIAALTNKKGNVLGLMPHPEAFVRNTQHPEWTTKALSCEKSRGAKSDETKSENASKGAEPHGLLILKNARVMAGKL